jgi:hypothetical protein
VADSDFDLRALYDAIDEQRRARHLWLGQPAPSFTGRSRVAYVSGEGRGDSPGDRTSDRLDPYGE